MRSVMSIPTFDEWLAHWFASDVGDYCWDDDLSACEITAYLTQLFERPSILLERFSPEIINKGLWAICGIETSYLQEMRDGDVPIAAQQRCVRAILVLYQDLFSRVCTAHYGHLDWGPEVPSPVNSICYMLWDMDQLQYVHTLPGGEHLVDPVFEVLSGILQLDSIACRESALHGLAHQVCDHRARVQGIIDDFLSAHPELPEPLTDYAKRAREGRVQ